MFYVDLFFIHLLDTTISFDDESYKSLLPLEPGKSLDLDLTIMPEQAWRAQPSVDKIESILTLSYSNEDGDGYEREIGFVVDVKVMASLSIENYEVYEISKHPSCCCLCFDVHNHASIDMKIEVVIKETQGDINDAFFEVNMNYNISKETYYT